MRATASTASARPRTAAEPRPSRGALLGRSATVLFLVLADQISKAAVFAWLGDSRTRHEVLGEWFAFWTSCNPGAAFGRLDDVPYLLVGGRLLAVVFLGVLVARAPRRPALALWGMVGVLSGALGNVIDNLWTGCEVRGRPVRGVRDFLDVWYEPLLGIDQHFPAFNVADACISVGAVLWILSSFVSPSPGAPDQGSPEEAREPDAPAG